MATIALACAGLTACGDLVETADEVTGLAGGTASTEQQILNGTNRNSPGTLNGAVSLYDDGNFFCSGTLINNSWVLTARHCYPPLNQVKSGTVKVAFGSGKLTSFNSGIQVRTVEQVVRHPTNFGTQQGVDIMLLRVSCPFIVNGSTSGYSMPLWPADPSELNGQSLLFLGSGPSQVNDPGLTTAGVLRSAQLRVISVTAELEDDRRTSRGTIITFGNNNPNNEPAGQLTLRGDSGGGVFATRNGVTYLAGVHRSSESDPARNMDFLKRGNSTATGTPEVRIWVANNATPDGNRYQVDPKGRFCVQYKTCGWSPVGAHPTASCAVDPAYTLIGGGAEIEGNSLALLTGSFPESDLVTWRASSKDHVHSAPHRLRAYAVGIHVNGMLASTLRPLMRRVEATSGPSSRPRITASLADGHFAVGGGSQVSSSGAGLLLTESDSPDLARRWTGAAKDHEVADSTGRVRVAVIGLPSCLRQTFYTVPGPTPLVVGEDWCFTRRTPFRETTAVVNGFSVATITPPSGFVPASVGGLAHSTGPGRMLHKLIPAIPGVNDGSGIVVSKDHNFVSPGTTSVTVFAIASQP